MRKIIDYTDATKEAITSEQEALGYRLVETQIHFDGCHLVFENDEPEPVRDLEAEIDELKDKYANLKTVVETLLDR